jgi:hypothetical protein
MTAVRERSTTQLSLTQCFGQTIACSVLGERLYLQFEAKHVTTHSGGNTMGLRTVEDPGGICRGQSSSWGAHTGARFKSIIP